VTAAILVWRLPANRLPVFLVAHGLLAALALLMPAARRAGAVGRLVGDWYPLMLVTALYTEVGLVNLADGRAYDRIVLGWEQALFGFQPALEWIRWSPSVWLSWILHLFYLAYYPITVGTPLALGISGRGAAMRRTVATIAATFYICYVTFLVFPVVGPRLVFPAADNAATRTFIAQLTAGLLEHAAAWGAAFPSSHVAVSVAATVAALGEWRALGLVLVVPTTLLMLGSVYGQFHYGVDALAGLGLGLLVALGARLTSRRDASSDHRAGAGRRPLDDSTRAAHASSSSRPIRAAEKPSRTV
jgi:PAP2 superfamily protein